MAISDDEAAGVQGATVIGSDGETLGVVNRMYNDNHTDTPSWAAVKIDSLHHSVSFVPLSGASVRGNELHVPFDKEQLRKAPYQEPGRDLTSEHELELFHHYGVASARAVDIADSTDPIPDSTVPAAGDGPVVTDPATFTMIRSEERLRVHNESHAVERVRLRKRIVTEHTQISVPVRHEEMVVERVPVDEADTSRPDRTALGDAAPATGSAADHSGLGRTSLRDGADHQEITLYAERPVVRIETVAVERIRFGKRTVTTQNTVGGEVRREQIELVTDPGVGEPDAPVLAELDPTTPPAGGQVQEPRHGRAPGLRTRRIPIALASAALAGLALAIGYRKLRGVATNRR